MGKLRPEQIQKQFMLSLGPTSCTLATILHRMAWHTDRRVARLNVVILVIPFYFIFIVANLLYGCMAAIPLFIFVYRLIYFWNRVYSNRFACAEWHSGSWDIVLDVWRARCADCCQIIWLGCMASTALEQCVNANTMISAIISAKCKYVFTLLIQCNLHGPHCPKICSITSHRQNTFSFSCKCPVCGAHHNENERLPSAFYRRGVLMFISPRISCVPTQRHRCTHLPREYFPWIGCIEMPISCTNHIVVLITRFHHHYAR